MVRKIRALSPASRKKGRSAYQQHEKQEVKEEEAADDAPATSEAAEFWQSFNDEHHSPYIVAPETETASMEAQKQSALPASQQQPPHRVEQHDTQEVKEQEAADDAPATSGAAEFSRSATDELQSPHTEVLSPLQLQDQAAHADTNGNLKQSPPRTSVRRNSLSSGEVSPVKSQKPKPSTNDSRDLDNNVGEKYEILSFWDEISQSLSPCLRHEMSRRNSLGSSQAILPILLKRGTSGLASVTNFDKLTTSPVSRRRLLWELIGMMCIFYDLAMTPLLAFNPPLSLFQQNVMRIISVYWTLEVPCSFFVGFHVNGNLELRTRRIARHYLTSWFLPDIVLVICDWILMAAETMSAEQDVAHIGQVSRPIVGAMVSS